MCGCRSGTKAITLKRIYDLPFILRNLRLGAETESLLVEVNDDSLISSKRSISRLVREEEPLSTL